MATATIMKRQMLFFIIVVVVLVVMIVNPCITQFSAAARSHHLQNRVKTPKGSFGDSNNNKSPSSSPSSSPTPQSIMSSTNNNDKVVIINFDDSHQSEYTYAKPILDKYGFKATFFEVCNWVEAGHHNSDTTTTWKDIAALQQDGMDIEAHTMTHPHINGSLSSADLDYEIGQSQQCLINHGINSSIFAYPYGEGSNNSAVVNIVAKYYNLARTDSKSALTFLHCDGSGNIDNNNAKNNDHQTDCRAYFSNGTLTPANRYSINSWAHRHIERECIANSAVIGTCTTVRREY